MSGQLATMKEKSINLTFFACKYRLFLNLQKKKQQQLKKKNLGICTHKRLQLVKLYHCSNVHEVLQK